MTKTRTYNLETVGPVTHSQANAVANGLFNICGGVKVTRTLNDSYTDQKCIIKSYTDYTYTLSIEVTRALPKAVLARIEGVATGIAYATR